MANLLDLSPDEFMFTLQEFGYSPDRRDELIRQYREHNSVFGALNRAAQERQAEIAGEGRRPVAGGFLSKPEGSLGMDAVRGLRVEPMAGLLGMLTGAGRAVEAPAAAYQGLIPMSDVPLEALGTAGMASLGGAAMTRPAGSVGMGGRVAGEESRAQTVARLLREGRQSEVTDDLLATLTPNDNAELFRLYNEGATGMDLPMDDASRMARAEAAGFDTQNLLYHGTDSSRITSFNPSMGAERLPATFLTDSRRVASTYGDNVGEYFANVDYPAEFDFYGRSTTGFDGESLTPAGLVRRVKGAADDAKIYGSETDTDLAFDLQSAGIDPMYADEIDSVRMRSVVDDFSFGGSPANNLAVFNPANIRARTARFDPRLSGNANLLAANRDQTVGLLSTAAAAEPRNAAERMARDILDMRAAGRAGEVTDEMMAQADPQYMFANTPLPMDEASRMARAGEFGDTGYHGTVEDYTNLRPSIQGKLGPGIYTAPEANYANSFAGKVYGEEEYLEGGNVMPLVMRSNPAPDIFRSEAGTMRRSVDDPFAGADLFTKYLDDLGFTGVKVNSEQTTLDPRNVRSRFARFDPEFAHLANLNAANFDPLAGLFGVLAAEEQRRQRNSQ